MSLHEWRVHLFRLYVGMRYASEHWPDNFKKALDWMDADCCEVLQDFNRLHESGVIKKKDCDPIFQDILNEEKKLLIT